MPARHQGAVEQNFLTAAQLRLGGPRRWVDRRQSARRDRHGRSE
ncbi:hypothetical protein [Acidithiobacillus ferrivorans]|nr:hypothetical protein [Acidithiobacillus ferrivorans]